MIKINIYSAGRFHVLDLARELSKLGYDVKFYSFVPTRRATFFGLSQKCSTSLFLPLSPLVFLERKLFPRKHWAYRLRVIAQDFLTGVIARKCDVTIAMSGEFVRSIEIAKRKGSMIIVERGSKHITEQRRILEAIPSLGGTKPVPDFNYARELKCYRIADYISVASYHAVRSFILNGFDANKLFRNPYGVDLSMFSYQPSAKKEYDVISVGAWSYQKGCDLTIEAIKNSNLKFLHVGGINDVSFPTNDLRFTHVDKVDQSELANYYNKAKVFLIPSRQEGLAMVQVQAIACNLPIIGSPDSGAEDLKDMVDRPDMISIIEDYTPEAVLKSIEYALKKYEELQGETYAGTAIDNLTWTAYGQRYASFLQKVL